MSISANSINFGNLLLPLSAQSSSGAIQLLCSKQAPYTIDLAYGGVYGQGKPGDGSYWEFTGSSNFNNYYRRSGYDVAANRWVVLENRVLTRSNMGYMSAAAVSSLGCTVNADRCYMGTTSYDYGVMKGMSKGDSVAYSIFIPGDTSKVWNAGKNSYSNSGTGQQEQINFQARIVPAQSSAAYPSPDFYADTVTATVKY